MTAAGEPLDLEPIQARLAALVEHTGCSSAGCSLEQESLRKFTAAARTDVPALLGEVRRLRADLDEAVSAVGTRSAALVRALHESMAQAWRESARQVRDMAAEMQTPAGAPPRGMPVVPVAIVEKLADRLDRQGEAAEELAKAVTS